ncbi:MAG: DUF1214 domain-containing protein [Beijerinckiaceae bacterium]|nr:DUF1214 domain-containing protein [Beijerinckiaceae bacterium]
MSLGAVSAKERGFWAPVLLLGKYLSAGAIGLLLGAFVTLAVVERGKGFGAVEIGPWTNWSRSGTSNIDPYSRAILAYSGEMPLSESEGASFVAYGDSNGAAFDPSCDYLFTGEIPLARYWTLTLLSPDGAPVANRAGRYGYTSSEILRSSNGQFEIAISRNARPGNWLPSGSASKFVLILRLYDSELGAPVGAMDAAKMPRLLKGRCE